MAITRSFLIYALVSIVTLYSSIFVKAAVHLIPHDDPSIRYIPSVCDLDCNRVCRNQWWIPCALSDGTFSHRTKGNNTSVNYSFKGSKITWYTRTANDGAKAVVYIDDVEAARIDTNTPTTNEENPVFTKSGLDPTVTHRISVLFDLTAFTEAYERFIDVHAFEYDDGVGTGSGGTSSTSSNSASSVQSSSTSSSTSLSSGASSGSSTASGSSTVSNRTSSPISTSSPNTLAPVLVTFTNGTVETISYGDSPGTTNSESKALSTASIVGAVLGVAGALCIFALCLLLVRRRRKQRSIPVKYEGDNSEHHYPPGSDADDRSQPRSHLRYHADPANSTDALFRNIPDSQFYTIRNPEDINAPRVTSTSKRRFPDHRTAPELHQDDDVQSYSPRLSSHPYQASDVSLDDQDADHVTEHGPPSPGSGTQMTTDSRESNGAHTYGMTQSSSGSRRDRSSGGTWLPTTPPPIYRR